MPDSHGSGGAGRRHLVIGQYSDHRPGRKQGGRHPARTLCFPIIRQPGGSGKATRWVHPLARHLDDFLTDLANAGASPHTQRAYRGDLLQFAAHHDGEVAELTATPIRAYLAELAELSPASRKRKRASVASFCKWAVTTCRWTGCVTGCCSRRPTSAAPAPRKCAVSIEAVRRRLGHASTETTQLSALLDGEVADAEIRAARRHRDRASR
ncbi:site-specific integrase [Nonomuraea roseola]|uniref:Site-specific integrase n=1 Tax=Nonomuraea roseola TaxID=46179 RepID=A0ABV5Q911_9ACTN